METQAIRAMTKAEVMVETTSVAIAMEEEDGTEIKQIKTIDMGD